MARLDQLAASRFTYAAGAAASVTVPAGVVVVSVKAHATSAGSLTITPAGPNQTAVAGSAIPLPASADWFELNLLDIGAELGSGTVLVFSGTDSYLVVYAKQTNG